MQSDRTAREFAVLIVAELLQITFFVRAQRHNSFAGYAGVAVFTAIMIVDNYSSAFLLFAEALWLACLLLARWAGFRRAGATARLGSGLAAVAGVALLAPLLPFVFASSQRAVREGAVDWIKVQPISWPLTVLRAASMSPALWRLFIALGVFGVWRGRHSAPLVFEFLTAWMAGPLLAAFAVTYLLRPMEFPRYVLVAFVGMFAFAGVGAAFLRSTALRILVALLIVRLSVPVVHDWLRHLRDVAWRDATMLADRTSAGGEIAVFPPGSVKVVRYYLAPDRRAAAVSLRDECLTAPVLILSGRGVARPEKVSAAEACYPRILKRLNLVEVREY